jgi:hypothetical protein
MSDEQGRDPFGSDPFEMAYDSMVDNSAGVVMVKVKARARSGWVVGVGSAKLAPGDEFDPVIGRLLTQSRAFADLADRLEREALFELGMVGREANALAEGLRKMAADMPAFVLSARAVLAVKRSGYVPGKGRALADRVRFARIAVDQLLDMATGDTNQIRRDASQILRWFDLDRETRIDLLMIRGLAGPSRYNNEEPK